MDRIVDFIRYLLGMPAPASAQAQGVDTLMAYLHVLMVVLFVGWFCYFLYVIWKFQKRRNKRGDYLGVRNHASSYIEFTVAGIEASLLLFIAVPLWAQRADGFPSEAESTVIQISAQQFAWNARYAGPDGEFGRQDMKLVSTANTFGVDPNDPAGKDDVQVLNVMHVPVNKPVIAYITSQDVIHSFKITPMRVTQDAIPGMKVPVWFTPTVEGTYQIHCAQLCGNGHAAMAQGMLVVDSPENYEKWLASKVGEPMESFE
jgi:cytochrome c oxidase subunit II